MISDNEEDLFFEKKVSKAVINKEPKYIEIEANKVTLIRVIDQSFYEGHLVIHNKIEKFVVFKFLQDKACYSITPILYFIPPLGKITINIKRFEKLTNGQEPAKDYIKIISAKASIEIQDVNDAKVFLKKDDIYSPDYQYEKLLIELDNGNNPINYLNIINERITIANEYNKQLNMNNVTSTEEVKKYIEEVKGEIELYEEKINELMSKLGDFNNRNIIKQPETIFDKNTFHQCNSNKDISLIHKDGIPIFLLVFFCSICLFIGKFIALIL